MTQLHNARRAQGQSAYHGGLAAEHSVAALYLASGHSQIASRWRGKSGEIDLIFANPGEVIFVEVKKAGSFDRALESLRPSQIERLYQAADEFMDTWHGPRDMRFDLALVNASGEIRTMENVFAMG